MKEYEHMIMAIDEVICHEVAGVICMENYKSCFFPKGFKKVFESFCAFREEYRINKEKYVSEGDCEVEVAKFQIRCREKREYLLKTYIDELKSIFPDIRYQEEVSKYFSKVEQEDVQTPEMFLTIYPLLISQIRLKEEGENKND